MFMCNSQKYKSLEKKKQECLTREYEIIKQLTQLEIKMYIINPITGNDYHEFSFLEKEKEEMDEKLKALHKAVKEIDIRISGIETRWNKRKLKKRKAIDTFPLSKKTREKVLSSILAISKVNVSNLFKDIKEEESKINPLLAKTKEFEKKRGTKQWMEGSSQWLSYLYSQENHIKRDIAFFKKQIEELQQLSRQIKGDLC